MMSLEQKRIIIMLSELHMGGAERQALMLAEYLVKERGSLVQIWGLQGRPGRVAEECDRLGIPWRIFPLRWFRGRYVRKISLLHLTLALRRLRPDILFPYLITPNTMCGLIWPWTGAHASIWNQRDHGCGRLDPYHEARAVRNTPYFLSNSVHAACFLKETLGAPSDRTRVINNGVLLRAPEATREEWRSRLEIDGNAFAACMIANLTQLKDHATLLHAWRKVLDLDGVTEKSPMLLLAGRTDTSDSTAESLKQICHELNLDGSVRFLGPVQDISGLVNASDLAVFSSHHEKESSPNGVLECMAGGLAVAGTTNPGVRMAVGEPFLARAGDAEDLADRILRLMGDPSLRAEIGEWNRLRVKTDFSRQRMCEVTAGVIIEIMEQAKRIRHLRGNQF